MSYSEDKQKMESHEMKRRNMEQQQIEMFGATLETVEQGYSQAICKGHYIMGIMSDAQEMMTHQQNEQARLMLNIAKYLMSEHGVHHDGHGRMI